MADWKRVKKLARYLKQYPRMMTHFNFQELVEEIVVHVDSDYAGCKTSRKSSCGGIVMSGKHVIKHWASTQVLVALSSGEAEFYALVKGICEGLGVRSLDRDLGGRELGVLLNTDSSAAKGIACRRGVGRVKHLETRTLWVQDHVTRGDVRVAKVSGESNIADLLTKYLGPSKLRSLLSMTPTSMQPGRSSLIPSLQGQ